MILLETHSKKTNATKMQYYYKEVPYHSRCPPPLMYPLRHWPSSWPSKPLYPLPTFRPSILKNHNGAVAGLMLLFRTQFTAAGMKGAVVVFAMLNWLACLSYMLSLNTETRK